MSRFDVAAAAGRAARLGGVVAAAAAVGWLALALLGYDPWNAAQSLVRGALGSPAAIAATLLRTGPLLLTGLAVAIAFRTGIWNIGAEGQLYAGALLATAFATRWANGIPAWLALPGAVLGGLVGGALWAGIAAWLRFRRGVSEVIATILLNFVAIQLVAWAVLGPLAEQASSYPQSDLWPEATRLPSWGRIHLGIPIGLILAVATHLFLSRTPEGFRWRAVGLSSLGARYAGISPARAGAAALISGGALVGLAGAFEIMGVTGRLYSGLSAGVGYTAIAVALLARLSPGAVVFAAFFFGALDAGASAMQRNAGVPASAAEVVQGVVILFSAVGAAGMWWRSRA